MSELLKEKKAAILTLGCKVNQYESDGMAKLLRDAGCTLVDFDEVADIYIVNTCSVTNIADRKSRQMLHRAKKQNRDAVVVAAGCYVQADKTHALSDAAVDLVIGNNCKHDIVRLLADYFADIAEQDYNFIDIGKTSEYEEWEVSLEKNKTRAYVKVQDGCNRFCSYCIIPYTRGRIRSRKPEHVLEEVKCLAEHGFLEIVLTGIHLSSYGLDMPEQERTDLGGLIAMLSALDGVKRIRLGSLEPRIITPEFLEPLSENERLCPHFHLSLQSACNETLKRMHRSYTIEEYSEKVALIRSYFEKPAITTDVIVGFPGETEEEFAVTEENLKRLQLYEMHVFKFSSRKGTAAARMDNQISEQIKNVRSKRLLALTREQKAAYEKQFAGDTLEVLLEEEKEIDGARFLVGHAKNYILVQIPKEGHRVGEIAQIKLGG